MRDNIDLKRVMITVWAATFPAMFFGMWNVGFQANTIMAEMGMVSQEGLRGIFIGLLAGYDATSIWDNVVHGAAYFLPIYATTFIVGIFGKSCSPVSVVMKSMKVLLSPPSYLRFAVRLIYRCGW